MFKVRYVPKVERFLDDLPPKTARRIYDKIEQITDNPFHFLEHFEGAGYKLRIGDYRAIIDVDFEKQELVVRILDHRSKVYKH